MAQENIEALALLFAEEEGKQIACEELPKVISRLQKLESNLHGHPIKLEAVKIVLAICNAAEKALDCQPPNQDAASASQTA